MDNVELEQRENLKMPFLDWVNKAQAVTVAGNVPYHLLNFESAYGDPAADNMLIQGDNLLALKALLPFYRGRVKCIFIDPPYNTQSAFEHYDDKLEHSQWLSMIHPRLTLLREFLSEAGSIWVTVDDNEAHYLKVLMDEVFGRRSFVASIAWEKDKGRRNDTDISSAHDHILLYARDRTIWKDARNLLPRTEAQKARYKNPDGDPRGPWLQGDNGTAKSGGEGARFPVCLPSGREVRPPAGNYWRFSEESFARALADGRVYFGKDGDSLPVIKRYLTDVKDGVVPRTWWPAEEAGTNQSAKRDHLRKMLPEIEPFATPKPEELVARALAIATNPGDIVFDSFLGSGTTAAVALKMRRRFVGIEVGDHAVSHCLPRLVKVLAGEQGGVSAEVGWEGGGGFRFYSLGEPVFDAGGSINPKVSFGALAGYLWHFETGEPATRVFDSPLLGVHDDTAVFLLYNGILGDRKPAGGNVLTGPVLAHLDQLLAAATPAGQALPTRKVIYGETTRLGDQRLEEAGITFRQIPYDIRAR